jgi:hypothetical protein
MGIGYYPNSYFFITLKKLNYIRYMLIKGNRFIMMGGRLALGGNKTEDLHYYTDEYTDYKYMTVVALEDDLEVSFPQDLQYCIDKSENW